MHTQASQPFVNKTWNMAFSLGSWLIKLIEGIIYLKPQFYLEKKESEEQRQKNKIKK